MLIPFIYVNCLIVKDLNCIFKDCELASTERGFLMIFINKLNLMINFFRGELVLGFQLP